MCCFPLLMTVGFMNTFTIGYKSSVENLTSVVAKLCIVKHAESRNVFWLTLGCFCTDCRFTAEPTELNLSWHYLNAFWDVLKTLDDKIIVYTCNCCSGFALALLTDGNSNRAFWSVDPHSDLVCLQCKPGGRGGWRCKGIQQRENQVYMLVLQWTGADGKTSEHHLAMDTAITMIDYTV